MITVSSTLKKDIQETLAELRKDRDVFERVEINSETLSEKYEGNSLPSAIFDFWYDKHKLLSERVENLENQGQELLKFVQGYFKACVEVSSDVGHQLVECVKKSSCFSVNQIRADLNFLNQTVKILILLKGNWTETELPSEKAINELNSMESDFFVLEDEFTSCYPRNSENQIQIRSEIHWLLMDSRLDADSITRDYPVSVRY